MVDALDFH